MKKFINIAKRKEGYLPGLVLILMILLAEFLIRYLEVKHYVLPLPSSVVKSLIEEREVLWGHTLTTLFEAGVGFLLATICAIITAFVMSRSRLLKSIFYPFLVISQTIPIIALAPLFLVWFGFGLLPKVIVVVLVCFFPIVVSLTEGLSVVDVEMIHLMKSMRAKKMDIFLKVEVPSALPAFFSGLKIAATYAIMGAVIAEWLGAKSGLGIYMTRVMHSHKTDALFADIFIIVVISIGLFKFIDILGRKLMPWQRGEK